MKDQRKSKLSPELRMRFRDYVESARSSADNLAFLLDNLGRQVALDHSVSSLAELETVYRRLQTEGIPKDLSDSEHFAALLCQYLGECIIRHTGARWVQCEDRNHHFGQPLIDGFGNEKWDRIYAVDLANAFPDLPSKKPLFPGVREQRVLAKQLEKAMKIFQKTSGGEGEPSRAKTPG